MTTLVRQMTTMVGAALVALASIGTEPALAHRHHRTHVVASQAPPAAAPATASSYYPENVEGGVRGNLPFNNQIRKFTDPLNANGAGR